ncbi:signal peptidase I [Okibacterium fritillariae]|uniref:signal peptidase I n=1 Tax=Okibacterium fritillariae TaxID=123320 RepID=UPI004055638E
MTATALTPTEPKASPLVLLARVFNFASYAVIVAAAVAVVFMLCASAFGGFQINRVMSQSMEPYLMTGDYIVTAPTDGRDLEVGTVITFEHAGENQGLSVTHRIIEVAADGSYIVQGDNNNVRDIYQPTAEDITGVLAHHLDGEQSKVAGLFLTTDEWRADAFTAISHFDWSALASIGEQAPWGVIALLALLLIVHVSEGRLKAHDASVGERRTR